MVSGRRSASVLQKDNMNDELPPATGWQAFLRAVTFGLIKPKVGAAELARRADLSAIQRVYSRPMRIMVAQPLGGVGKTMCSVGIGSTFGIHSGQHAIVWDNNEMMGTARCPDQRERLHPHRVGSAERAGEVRNGRRPQGRTSPTTPAIRARTSSPSWPRTRTRTG